MARDNTIRVSEVVFVLGSACLMEERSKYTKWLAREAQLSQKHEEM